MGTKPAPLNVGEQMWLRKSAQRGHRGGPCWILAPLVPEGMDPALYQTRDVRILTDDGSGRPWDVQLADARSAVRIYTVARGQLVAFGTATWFRESHQAFQANLRTELALANATANALEVPDGTQV